jgi:phosphoribosylanthranilate isomerase
LGLYPDFFTMTLVKICGVTSVGDAAVAVDAGADMVGLIFYPPSPRYVTPGQAQVIVASLPPELPAIGVFVNESLETITGVARESGISRVQLHGDESPDLCRRLPWRCIKTFRFTEKVQPEMMPDYPVHAFLIEGFHGELYGGGGVKADWCRVATLHGYGRIILAGGLTPDNVQEAVATVRPYAVDVCSGVEATPGRKDTARVRAFVKYAKSTTSEGEARN